MPEGRLRRLGGSTTVLLLAAILLFGASWPAVKIALITTSASPFWLAAVRSCLACLTLLILRGGRLVRPAAADAPALLAIGVLQLTAFFLCCHLAVRSVPAGQTAILSNAALIWVVPLTALFGQKEPALRWFAAMVTLCGVVVIVQPWAIDWGELDSMAAYLALLVAAFAWACTILVIRARPPQLHVLELLPWSFAISACLLIALAMILEPTGGIPPGAWPVALFNGMIVAPFGTSCLIELSRRLSPMIATIAIMAIPLTGVLMGNFILGERIGYDLICGGLLIALGMIMASRS
ncbi:DMT family transporter [Roseicella frigidaeris]|uniref:DMT family transporter n=1 Tax=Roseicella frigidaeris TaxID=2230885 RepID=UPI001401C151|nr:DMT family transporter [Roseicella frigidaeris]